MKHWRLRTRMMFAYAGLILLGFGLLALLSGQQISQGATDDYERNLITQAGLMARALRNPVESYIGHEGEVEESNEDGANQGTLVEIVQEYARDLNARVLLIDHNGTVWLDTQGAMIAQNLAGDSQVAAALQAQTTSDVRDNEQGEATVYVAAPIMEDGRVLSILLLASPLTAAQELVIQRWLGLVGGVILLAVLAVLASLWLSTSMTRPLETMRASAMRMAEGDLSQRLPQDRSDEFGELAASFNHMAAEVEAMLLEQRAFAGNASHELRTPLTTIRLRSEALREGGLDEETTRQYITEIDDEVARLGNLVNDLILLSRFDSGRAEQGNDLVDPVRLAQSIRFKFEPQLAAQGLQLTLDMPDDLPALAASRSHLQVVFRNLLENAMRYTPPGGCITWRMWLEGDVLRSTVTDTGQGIAAEDLPHIFERFYRADKARTREAGGVGLGLPLTRSIVEFYNGRIAIDSPGLGKGTTASVWWPLNTAA
ncbi:MAG: HAMP domain-containing protein [Ardenticatenaceae bacterium]|nr:HAMP domain-containing protein [Ardenticatenaceae bacterium]